MKHKNKIFIFICIIAFLLCGCSNTKNFVSSEKINTNQDITSKTDNTIKKADIEYRDNTPQVLIPKANGTIFYKNEKASIDASNSSQGYVIVNYKGSSKKVKLQIHTPTKKVYTVTLNGGEEVFPLACGNGEYTFNVLENITEKKYSQVMSYTLNVELENEFSAFLYPNQYVNFNKDTRAVGIAKELVKSAKSDLEAVEIIFNYVVDTIEYDYDKAKTVKSGYLPNVDEILQLKKGICFDYSAVMATMLRTQKIPTIMEIGYANEIYHAWISVYTKEKGWISGIIQFDGYNWKIVDPTFADGDNKSEKIKSFINNSSNYSVEFKF